jgi:hypothetical protein
LLFTSVARGDAFRCGDRVVSTRESKMDVISKCGSPDDSEMVSYDTRDSVSNSGNISASTKKVEKLYYNYREGRLIRILTLMNGRLIRIERGGYGSGPQKCD